MLSSPQHVGPPAVLVGGTTAHPSGPLPHALAACQASWLANIVAVRGVSVTEVAGTV